MINEIKIMQITHECINIIHLEEIFEDEHNVYLVMEYFEEGDLL
jgi:serine/threonine protein kinase